MSIWPALLHKNFPQPPQKGWTRPYPPMTKKAPHMPQVWGVGKWSSDYQHERLRGQGTLTKTIQNLFNSIYGLFLGHLNMKLQVYYFFNFMCNFKSSLRSQKQENTCRNCRIWITYNFLHQFFTRKMVLLELDFCLMVFFTTVASYKLHFICINEIRRKLYYTN